MSINSRRNILALLIILSLLPLPFFVDWAYWSFSPLRVVARLGGLFTAVGLFWSTVLGARGLVGRLVVDLAWVNKIHQRIGKYGSLTILLHVPVIMLIYIQEYNILLPFVGGASPILGYLILGMIAFDLLLVIWISSALLRKRLSFKTWHIIHMLTYLIAPLALIHSLGFGSSKPMGSRYYWMVLIVVYVLICLYQIAYYTGWSRSRYIVKAKNTIAYNVNELVLTHKSGKKIAPKPGQFLYIQYPLILSLHPFSVVNYVQENGDIVLAIKDLGMFTHMLEGIQVDDEFLVDGPYGVFTKEVYQSDRPSVLISGGIGITPFMPILNYLERLNKPIFMINGNKSRTDIAYFDQLAQAEEKHSNFKVMHVLEQVEGKKFKQGYITIDLIKQHVGASFTEADFFVCGPPVMMKSVILALLSAGVDKQRIFSEKFSW